ncbi:protein mono-ADP-ribosyltransferase PARP14-like isoform X2 [Mauremys reevesii]|uniref:protein mono-ADP-ribosyltransferase PARP14-like isoform X2 n=1 Tax=Mauremys reevesii TaxID=260615 RepID=UPI00193F2CB6|nr:protein mono-ADP-ribosyltransferase PARP14-like isoform X2 [Mauremys reevesii]
MPGSRLPSASGRRPRCCMGWSNGSTWPWPVGVPSVWPPTSGWRRRTPAGSAGWRSSGMDSGRRSTCSRKWPLCGAPGPPSASAGRSACGVRVLTGQFTQGKENMVLPPEKPDGGGRYDSVVNVVSRPSIFVTFFDDLTYPEYLITFRGTRPPLN